MVSPEPDVLAYPLAADDHIIFLASDGVWDNLEEEEIFEAVKTFLADHSTKGFLFTQNYGIKSF
jgi:serine/threonine protein phosphatase PrpC